MGETFEYLKMFARFPFGLSRFLKHKLTLDEARQRVRARMDQREEIFLRVVRQSIFGYPRSPYLALLRHIGCELDDLRALVRKNGVEGALSELRQAGVYVTFEEFKGRKPIVRDSLALPVTTGDFDNPFARRDFVTQTSGSTGLAVGVNQALDQIAAESIYHMLGMEAQGLSGLPVAMWSALLPGPGLKNVLLFESTGERLMKWFSPSGWRDSKSWLRYDAATLYMLFWMRACGMHAPTPEIVNREQVLVIVRWIQDMLRKYGRCHCSVSTSKAVRICEMAKEANVDLRGLTFRGGGEPLTQAKADIIRNMGARYIPVYAMTEAGAIAQGCIKPTECDDMHLSKDAYALITHSYAVPGSDIAVPAFNLTTLLDTAPKVMFNLQADDYGIAEERHCGCGLEDYGYTTHLREIRSYGKLVSEGATLIGNDMVRILEQVLPARFGGTALDYQLMEQEDEHGFTRLRLLISPRVEIADEAAVIATVLSALRDSSPMADAARRVWQQAQTIQIMRMEPVWTRSGKLLPLHIERRARKQ